MSTYAEETYHAPADYLDASSRRKTVIIFLMAAVILGLIVVNTKLALAPKDAYFAVEMPNGETYIISSPKKKLDIRADVLGYESVRMSLMSFAESYFERSGVTARKDWDHARWFIPDHLLAGYDQSAQGDKGWINGLVTHAIPESHARINTIELRDEDIQKEPYQARVYFSRTNLVNGEVTHWIATLVFVVRPDTWADQKKTQRIRFSRFPLYNALGVLIVKPIEEIPDFRDVRK
jgi:hypothetical protein